MSQKLSYIPALDGLRGLAVLMVVLFHSDPHWIPGGFVGVDVFFVLSGFLITQIVIKDLNSDRFSYFHFIAARIRRLFPAYLLVLLFVLGVGFWLLLPAELENLSKSAVYAIFFLSNVFFHQTSGYFDAAAETKALLHTWSLAVEWQFYIVYPFLLICFQKVFREQYGLGLLLAIVLSFAVSCWLLTEDSAASFYLLPSRAWELMAGGALSLMYMRGQFPKQENTVGAALGLLFLLFTAVFYTGKMSFPGWNALLPVVGTLCVIYAVASDKSGLFSKFLTSKVLIHFGKISYSLYLVHWPILLFFEFAYGQELGLPGLAMSWVCMYGLSIISFHYIENSFRRRKDSKSLWPVYFVAAAAALPILAVAFALFRLEGAPQRVSSEVTQFVSVTAWGDFGRCSTDYRLDEYYSCVIGSPEATPEVLIWGDSHAQTLIPTIDEAGKRTGIGLRHVTKGGCPPIFSGVAYPTGINASACLKSQNTARQFFTNQSQIKQVILVARWDLYWDKTLQHSEQGHSQFPEAVAETITALVKQGVSVKLVGSLPEPGFDVVNVIGRKIMLDAEYSSHYIYEPGVSKAPLQQLAAQREMVHFLDLADHICDSDNRCAVIADGKALYFDDNHLSQFAARKLIMPFVELLSAKRD